MAVRLRLRREGTKKQPHYRVVAADKRSPRNGKFIEIIGEYHPMDDPSTVEIDHDRALHWLRNGAQPSDQVKKLLRIVGVWQEFKPDDEPTRERSKLTQEQAEEAARLRREAEEARRAEELQADDEDAAPDDDADDAEDAEAAGDDAGDDGDSDDSNDGDSDDADNDDTDNDDDTDADDGEEDDS